MIVFLTDLGEKGAGVSDASSLIIQNLKGKIPFKVIDYYNYYKYFSKIPLKRSVILFLLNKFYFPKIIKNNVIHSLSPGIISNHKILKLADVKIITVHDTYVLLKNYHEKKFLFFIPSKRIRNDLYNLEDYDYVLSISDLTTKYLTDIFKLVSPKKVITINWDIIPDAYTPLEKTKHDKIIIGYINNLNWNKKEKFIFFVNTFKQIKNKNIEFHIYGKISKDVLELIKNDNRIKYFGFLSEDKVPSVLNSFDAYLSTSIIEGFGIPIMKAKACKIPVLCYNGEIPDVVKRNTLLWNENNLKEILENQKWADVDVEKAYEDVKGYRAEYVIKGLLDFYNKIL